MVAKSDSELMVSSDFSHGAECVAIHCQGLFGNYCSLCHVPHVSPPSDWSEWILLIIGPQSHVVSARKHIRRSPVWRYLAASAMGTALAHGIDYGDTWVIRTYVVGSTMTCLHESKVCPTLGLPPAREMNESKLPPRALPRSRSERWDADWYVHICMRCSMSTRSSPFNEMTLHRHPGPTGHSVPQINNPEGDYQARSARDYIHCISVDLMGVVYYTMNNYTTGMEMCSTIANK